MVTVNNLQLDCGSLTISTNVGLRTLFISNHKPDAQQFFVQTQDVIIAAFEPKLSRVFYVTQSNTRLMTVQDISHDLPFHSCVFGGKISSISVNSLVPSRSIPICVVNFLSRLMIYNPRKMSLLSNEVTDYDSESSAIAIHNAWVAYPSRQRRGSVRVFQVGRDRSFLIQCFDELIGAVQLSEDRHYLGAVSVRADVVRVFDVADGVALFQFGRGVMRSVTITSLVFCGLKYLVASSDSPTVHVFHLSNAQPQSLLSSLVSLGRSSLGYLPFDLAHTASLPRASASIHLPCGGGHMTRTAIHRHNGQPILYVASSSGYFYCFCLDEEFNHRQVVSYFFMDRLDWTRRP